jgi:hypothetical protein
MLPSVLRSERFQTELTRYRTALDQMSEGAIKTELQGLVNKLLAEVKLLDNAHSELAMNKQLGNLSPDIRDNITQIRKRLQTIVRDWEEAQKA